VRDERVRRAGRVYVDRLSGSHVADEREVERVVAGERTPQLDRVHVIDGSVRRVRGVEIVVGVVDERRPGRALDQGRHLGNGASA